jgi:hypothetical protein
MRTIIVKSIGLALLAALLTVSACKVEPEEDESSFFETDIKDLPSIPDTAGLYVNGDYKGYMTFNQMLDWIAGSGSSGNFYAMVIDADQTIMPVTFSGKSNIIIMLKSDGQARTFNLNQNGTMFTAGKSVTLVLEDKIILRGRSGNSGSIISVETGGRLIMNGGEIKENTSYWPAVRVNGTFIMNGGSIHDNSGNHHVGGGGVYSSGSFTLNGGEIVRNTSNDTGGGGVSNYGSFVMNGGKIADNRVTYGYGGRTYGYGGGVYSYSGSLEIKGGEITGNTASIYGGGIYSNNNLTMSDGVIHGNTANSGGGICGTKNISITGGVISGNNATQEGGGIYFSGAKFIKSASGGVIYGLDAASTLKNTSGNNNGHAVYKSGSPIKQRNTTVESNMSLESDKFSGWE